MSLPSLAGLSLKTATVGAPKRKRGTNVLFASTTTGTGSLDTNGMMTAPLPSSMDTSSFVSSLRQSANQWFNKGFRAALADPTWATKLCLDKGSGNVRRDRDAWIALSQETQDFYRKKIDLSTNEGMACVFDNRGYLLKRSWFRNMPAGRDWFVEAITYARAGNSNSACGPNVAGAWTKAGFGFWAHLVFGFGLRALEHAMETMLELGLVPDLPTHFPHVIYKPPGGSPLVVHHDQMSPLELIAKLGAHVASADASTTSWVKQHGLQALVHLSGGRGTDDGATFVIGPMTPKKLLLCLEAYSSGKISNSKHNEWNTQPAGKADLPWIEHLDEFNRVLANAGFGPVGRMPIAPGEQDAHFAQPGHLLVFPVGWPHGSFANSTTEDPSNKQGSRITLTMPIRLASAAPNPRYLATAQRIPDRLRWMATLSTDGKTNEEYEVAEAWLAADLKTYADGSTHVWPEKVAKYIRCPDAARALNKEEGAFYRITAKPDEIDRFYDFIDDHKPMMYRQRELLALAHLGSAPPLGDSTKILKVRQPWAAHLVKGIKDVENRSWRPPAGTAYPTWVLIASSMSKPTSADMLDLKKRLAKVGNWMDIYYQAEEDMYDYGAIIGAIELVGCAEPNTSKSVWYNRGDFGWIVGNAVEFIEPIPLRDTSFTNGVDPFQTSALLGSRPMYRERVLNQMAIRLGLRPSQQGDLG